MAREDETRFLVHIVSARMWVHMCVIVSVCVCVFVTVGACVCECVFLVCDGVCVSVKGGACWTRSPHLEHHC